MYNSIVGHINKKEPNSIHGTGNSVCRSYYTIKSISSYSSSLTTPPFISLFEKPKFLCPKLYRPLTAGSGNFFLLVGWPPTARSCIQQKPQMLPSAPLFLMTQRRNLQRVSPLQQLLDQGAHATGGHSRENWTMTPFPRPAPQLADAISLSSLVCWGEVLDAPPVSHPLSGERRGAHGNSPLFSGSIHAPIECPTPSARCQGSRWR